MSTKRKEQIFQVMLEIISREGVSAVSTLRVAEELGISQPAIYKHFHSKDEMLIFFVDNLDVLLQNNLRKIDEGKNTRDKINKFINEHFRMLQKTRVLPRVIFSDTLHIGNPEIRKHLRTTIFRYKSHLMSIIQEGIDNKEITVAIEADAATTIIFGSILANTLFWMLDGMNTSLLKEKEKCQNFLLSMLFQQ